MSLSIYEKLQLAINALEECAKQVCEHSKLEPRMTDDGAGWCTGCEKLVTPGDNIAKQALEKLK